MKKEQLIPIDIFCVHHQVDFSFIHSLEQYGLIEIKKIKKTSFIPQSKIVDLEKLIRLHYELDINLAGIDAITNLLHRVKDMQHEIRLLRNRLTVYEDIE